jgi:protein-tyrosine-phosphatase
MPYMLWLTGFLLCVTKSGASAPGEGATEVAEEFNVDLEDHRSQPLRPEVIRCADAIFAFDERNYREVRRRFPEARSRLHLLGALGDGPLTIEDPIDGDTACFRRVYAALAHALRQAA